MNKLQQELFIGKVADEIGVEKTSKLLKEVKKAIPDQPKKTFKERLDEYKKQNNLYTFKQRVKKTLKQLS